MSSKDLFFTTSEVFNQAELDKQMEAALRLQMLLKKTQAESEENKGQQKMVNRALLREELMVRKGI
jgi:hypothetical protein